MFLDTYVRFLYIIQKKGCGFIREHTEFSNPQKLEGDSANYFMIPSSLIYDKDIDPKRITIFSFFSMRRGLDRAVTFSINSLAQWMGRQPNRNKNGINNKIVKIIEYLQSKGFIALTNEIETAASVTEIYFDIQKVISLCQIEYFAIIYIDELKKILGYKKTISDDMAYNIDITLLVFAFLRMVIPKRPNKLRPEEINSDGTNRHIKDVENRRKAFPEAYDSYYRDIAANLGISERQISNAVAALSDMGLIYYEALPRIKDTDGNCHTSRTIFCNYYKRELSSFLDGGSNYYHREIANKIEKLNKLSKKRGNNIEYAKQTE